MPPCNHPKITAYVTQHSPADEPPFADVKLICDECGDPVDFDDRPAGAIIRDQHGNRLDQFEREAE
jgi:hypothetical protein